jgi:hypothetical protein
MPDGKRAVVTRAIAELAATQEPCQLIVDIVLRGIRQR